MEQLSTLTAHELDRYCVHFSQQSFLPISHRVAQGASSMLGLVYPKPQTLPQSSHEPSCTSLGATGQERQTLLSIPVLHLSYFFPVAAIKHHHHQLKEARCYFVLELLGIVMVAGERAWWQEAEVVGLFMFTDRKQRDECRYSFFFSPFY